MKTIRARIACITAVLLTGTVVSLAVLAGCGGATRTPGTEGVPVRQLAEVRVIQHTGIRDKYDKVHIGQVVIDGHSYSIGGDKTFLMTPGLHSMNITYEKCVHPPAEWLTILPHLMLLAPRQEIQVDVREGARYTLAGETLGGGSIATNSHWLEEQPPEKPATSSSSR